MGSTPFGIDLRACEGVASAIKALRDAGVQTAVVIGGGNIFRGIRLEGIGMERTAADHMGMLATLINGIALQQELIALDCPVKLMSALDCPLVVEAFNRRGAIEALQKGEALIFVGGTGSPYFTTDTAAALRACEIKADILLKATKVDGVYDKDPMQYSDAVKYDRLTYSEALEKNLRVMDAACLALCRDNRIPIMVFNMASFTKEEIITALIEKYGTLVKGDEI